MFRTTPEVLQEFVPKPLLPIPYNLMFIYIGRLNIESPVAGRYDYLEAGIVIPVVSSKAPGNYPVCLYLSSWTHSPLCYNPDECLSFGGERSSNGRF